MEFFTYPNQSMEPILSVVNIRKTMHSGRIQIFFKKLPHFWTNISVRYLFKRTFLTDTFCTLFHILFTYFHYVTCNCCYAVCTYSFMKTTYWIKNQYNHNHIYLRGLVTYLELNKLRTNVKILQWMHSFILITYISPETKLFTIYIQVLNFDWH